MPGYLTERTRLENLQRALDERARQRVPDSSRCQLFPQPTQVYRTPIQNLAAAARIAESIQPYQSEAGRGLLQIRDLLWAAGDQNSAVSQSRNRIHSKSVAANTVQLAHSPRSPRGVKGVETGTINTRTMSSMITESIAMIDIECPPLPLGVDPTYLDSGMIDASTVAGEGFQSTPGNQALMRDPSSFKV